VRSLRSPNCLLLCCATRNDVPDAVTKISVTPHLSSEWRVNFHFRYTGDTLRLVQTFNSGQYAVFI
jgi:hypothetical protein